MNLITGRTGTDHVLARHDAMIHRTLLGDGDFVLQYKDNMSWSPVEGRELAINPGALIMQGRLCEITAQEVVPVNVCSAENLKKLVYICAEYTIDNYGIENVRLMTIEGREASNVEIEPEVPYEDGVIDDGETHQMVLYAVHVEGFIINHSKVEQKFTLLETEPIQTALDYARSSIENINTMVKNAMSDISHGIKGQWKKTVDVTLSRTEDPDVSFSAGGQESIYTLGSDPQTGTTITIAWTRSSEETESGTITFVGGTDSTKDIVSNSYTLGDITYNHNDNTLTFHSANDLAGTLSISEISYLGGTAVMPISVDMGETYTHSESDVIDVYCNGIRLTEEEYDVSGFNNTISIDLTNSTFVGPMEIIVMKLAEEV